MFCTVAESNAVRYTRSEEGKESFPLGKNRNPLSVGRSDEYATLVWAWSGAAKRSNSSRRDDLMEPPSPNIPRRSPV